MRLKYYGFPCYILLFLKMGLTYFEYGQHTGAVRERWTLHVAHVPDVHVAPLASKANEVQGSVASTRKKDKTNILNYGF